MTRWTRRTLPRPSPTSAPPPPTRSAPPPCSRPATRRPRLPTVPAGVTQVTNQPIRRRAQRLHRPGVVQRRRRVPASCPAASPRWPPTARTYYAGTADGGVWKLDQRGHDLDADLGHHGRRCRSARSPSARTTPLWVGTGEANTNSDSYLGIGVYRSTNGGAPLHPRRRQRTARPPGLPAASTTASGTSTPRPARASTGTGDAAAGAWELVLKPDPNPTSSPVRHLIHHRRRGPARHRRQNVLAVLGWRNGTAVQRLLPVHHRRRRRVVPRDHPVRRHRRHRHRPHHACLRRRRVAAVRDDPVARRAARAAPTPTCRASTCRPDGNPAGPWTLIADSDKLDASGSALTGPSRATTSASRPGTTRRWPSTRRTPSTCSSASRRSSRPRDGGTTFTTASPYWNYGLACGDDLPEDDPPRPARGGADFRRPTWSSATTAASTAGRCRSPATATGPT